MRLLHLSPPAKNSYVHAKKRFRKELVQSRIAAMNCFVLIAWQSRSRTILVSDCADGTHIRGCPQNPYNLRLKHLCRELVSLWLLVLAFGLAVFGQESPQTPYERPTKKDWLAAGVAGGLALVPLFLEVDHPCADSPCDRSNVNRFDRSFAGRENHTIDKVSWGAAAAATGWPAVAIFRDEKEDRLTDSFVTGQAVLMNVAVNQWVKYATHRPRPCVYSLEKCENHLNKNSSYHSFYSQHTSIVFAAGISYARTYALRHPKGRRWLVYTAAVGGGAAVGSMRVLAGRHFPTDVMTGAAVGTTMGLLIPWLYRKGPISGLTVLPVPWGAAVSLPIPFGN